MKKIFLLAALAAASLTIQSCSQNGTKDTKEVAENSNEARVENDQTALTGSSDEGDKEDDSSFMMEAADGGMLEIEASKLALTKTSSTQVKNFAQMIIKDHTRMASDMATLAMQKKVDLPVGLSKNAQDEIKELTEKSGVDFDHDYMDLMQEVHEKDEKLFEKASKEATDADVKAMFAKELATIKMHMDQAKMGEAHQDDRKDAM
jgi:putative membrane protein